MNGDAAVPAAAGGQCLCSGYEDCGPVREHNDDCPIHGYEALMDRDAQIAEASDAFMNKEPMSHYTSAGYVRTAFKAGADWQAARAAAPVPPTAQTPQQNALHVPADSGAAHLVDPHGDLEELIDYTLRVYKKRDGWFAITSSVPGLLLAGPDLLTLLAAVPLSVKTLRELNGQELAAISPSTKSAAVPEAVVGQVREALESYKSMLESYDQDTDDADEALAALALLAPQRPR